MTMMMMDTPTGNSMKASAGPDNGWILVGSHPGQSTLTRTSLARFPFRIGRDPASDLPLASRNVSKRHAELLHTPIAVIVRDLGSTNGTYVNGHRISNPTPVGDRDLIQFADVELFLSNEAAVVPEHTNHDTEPERNWVISRMHEVLNNGRMTIFYQPIVIGDDRRVFGYEALVRSDVEGLQTPLALFAAAERLGQEERLSQRCRSEAVRILQKVGLPGALFLNTHPHEVLGPELVESLRELRGQAGDRRLVLEIHEEAVTDVTTVCEFRAALREMNIQLAFDDFGAGQSRLLELAKVRPDFLKFDRSLVKDLGTPAATHSGLVRGLHEQAVALGIATLAEGLETPESIAACHAIGFTHFQGFAFGRPQPVSALAARE